MLEAYGMTEASHQMASNPLPPGARKPGSVGVPSGVEIRIVDARRAGRCRAGSAGEVVIRGPGVTAGYLDNPEANADVVLRRLVPDRRPRLASTPTATSGSRAGSRR